MNKSEPDHSLISGMPERAPVLRMGYEQLRCGLLNRDSAGMIAERLPQELLATLNIWASDPDEWDRGRPLTMDAPLFDAFLAECVLQTEAADIGGQEQCWFLFVLGLRLGSELRPVGCYETSVSFDAVLRRLAQLDHADLPPTSRLGLYYNDAMRIRADLARLAPGVDRLVLAGYRLTRRANLGRQTDSQDLLLFLFVLGLIGAGVQVPWENWETDAASLNAINS